MLSRKTPIGVEFNIRSFQRLIYLFFLAMFLFSDMPVQSMEISLEQLIEGVNMVRMDIKSGELRLFISETRPPRLTTEEAKLWYEKEKRKLAMQNELSDKRAREISEIAEEMTLEKRRYEEHNVSFEILDFNSRNSSGLYRYKEIIFDRRESPTNPLDTPIQDPNILIYDGNIQLCIDETEYISLYQADRRRGFEYFHLFGRSALPIQKANLIGKEMIGNNQYYVLEYSPTGKDKVRLWICPDKGFTVLKQEYFNSSNVLAHELRCLEYRCFPGNIWYPMRMTAKARNGETITIEIKEAEFNIQFPKDFFEIDLEKIADTVAQRKIRISSDSNINLLPERIQLFSQNDANPNCGPKSLLAILKHFHISATLQEINELTNYDEVKGTTMIDLKRAAKVKGLNPLGIKTDFRTFSGMELPAIVHFRNNHFVVIWEIKGNNVRVFDPNGQYDIISIQKFKEVWDGYSLIFRWNPIKEPNSRITTANQSEENKVILIHDFGAVQAGKTMEYTFTIFNPSDTPLEISRVTKSCACMATLLFDRYIASGKKGEVKVSFKMPDHEGDTEKSVTLYTNDPARSPIELVMRASVYVPIAAVPSQFFLGRFLSRKGAEKNIKLYVKNPAILKVINVRTSASLIECEYNQRESTVHIKVASGMPVGIINESVLVDYVYENSKSELEIPINGEVIGDIDISPRRFFFGLADSSELPERKVTLSGTHGNRFKVTGVKNKSECVSVEVIVIDPGNTYEIKAKITSNAPKGQLYDTITIKTDHPDYQKIEIPLYCIVR